MQMSIREAKARLSEAVAAVERGEDVLLTKRGKPVAQLVQPTAKTGGFDFAAADRYLASIGWAPPTEALWPTDFDDTAFSRTVLGLDD